MVGRLIFYPFICISLNVEATQCMEVSQKNLSKTPNTPEPANVAIQPSLRKIKRF